MCSLSSAHRVVSWVSEPSERRQLPAGADVVSRSALDDGEGDGRGEDGEGPNALDGRALGRQMEVVCSQAEETEAEGCWIGIKSNTLI